MVLITSVLPFGGLGGWRHSSHFERPVMNLEAMIELAQIAERGKFHSLFLADGNAVRQMEKRELFENVAPSDRPSNFEPATLMAALSQHTEHIGMFTTLTTTYNQPYSVARQLASLDHLSNGRAAWNVVTTSYPGDAANFGSAPFPEREPRYARAIEFVEVCKELWDSWAGDAFPQDKESGKFLDAERVRKIHHHGEYFDVEGPLNVARMPQGYPVLFMAGQSEPGREFAAKHAECLFASAKTKEQGKELRDDIRSRMAKYGRDPDEIKIIPGVGGLVGRTREEAKELRAHLASLVSDKLALQYLSAALHEDMSQYDPDGPLPDLTHEIAGVRSARDTLYAVAKAKELTVRQTWTSLITADDSEFTGTGEDIADAMQEWFEYGACDGFNIGGGPVQPMGLTNFVDLVVPILQERGLFREDYTGGTLRDELGLKTPINPYFDLATVGGAR